MITKEGDEVETPFAYVFPSMLLLSKENLKTHVGG